MHSRCSARPLQFKSQWHRMLYKKLTHHLLFFVSMIGINMAGVKWVIRLQLILLFTIMVAAVDFLVGSFITINESKSSSYSSTSVSSTSVSSTSVSSTSVSSTSVSSCRFIYTIYSYLLQYVDALDDRLRSWMLLRFRCFPFVVLLHAFYQSHVKFCILFCLHTAVYVISSSTSIYHCLSCSKVSTVKHNIFRCWLLSKVCKSCKFQCLLYPVDMHLACRMQTSTFSTYFSSIFASKTCFLILCTRIEFPVCR